MACKICGDENAKYYPSKLGSFCPTCAKETPRKVSRECFDLAYWGKERETVPESTKREFYDDYKSSVCNLERYIAETQTEVDA